jgi:hypothetical protein
VHSAGVVTGAFAEDTRIGAAYTRTFDSVAAATTWALTGLRGI